MKVSNTTADRLLQLEGTVVIPGQNQTKFVMLPPNYIEQLESKEDEEDSEMVEMAEVVDETDIIEHAMSPTATDLIGKALQLSLNELLIERLFFQAKLRRSVPATVPSRSA